MTSEADVQLTSDVMNDLLVKLDGADDLPYEAFGGKAVPYIGWFWRHVWFDTEDYWFGLLPEYALELESNDKLRAGFMENNKWGYDYCYCPPDDWLEIKQLLGIALANQTRDNFKAVDNKIQSLLEQGTERKYKDFPRD
jgi:hypothetical protein